MESKNINCCLKMTLAWSIKSPAKYHQLGNLSHAIPSSILQCQSINYSSHHQTSINMYVSLKITSLTFIPIVSLLFSDIPKVPQVDEIQTRGNLNKAGIFVNRTGKKKKVEDKGHTATVTQPMGGQDKSKCCTTTVGADSRLQTEELRADPEVGGPRTGPYRPLVSSSWAGWMCPRGRITL